MRTIFLILIPGLLLLTGRSAVAGNPPQKEVMFLSGTDNRHTVDWEFFCTGGRKSGTWTTIPVPSCWEQQGFGTYNYGRDYVTYGRKVVYADEQGLYRYRFSVPAGWAGRTIRIVFEGSMTDTEVKVNGNSAGEIHRGAFYRFVYDITDWVRPGAENLLEVTVSKMSSDPTVNSAERYADYWIFGGIFRPVYLESFPEQHMTHATVWGDMNGVFHAQVHLSLPGSGLKIEAGIFDAEGRQAASCSAMIPRGDTVARLGAVVDGARLWSPETPDLYRAVINLWKGKELLYSMEEKFGFRTVEIRRSDGIYLNGAKVRMKGVNRHAFWPETGRTLNPGIDLMDVQMMKDMNMNAVRCSHYPPDVSFLEICDSLGLFVLNELAGWQNAYGTVTGRKLVREMVLRDVNHPSVIFWSNGNEGGTNRDLDGDFLQHDPTGRMVIHCHHRPGNDFNGIDTNHYESYQSTKQILGDSLIYMTTEFLHGQNDGGAGAGLYDYWELMQSSDRSAGGFLWAFIDEGIVRTDWNGAVDVNLVNAPDGILGPHREKEGSFYAIRDIFSPVVIPLKDLSGDFSGHFPLENRFLFTSLEKCSFRWELLDFPAPAERITCTRVAEEGVLPGPGIGPGGKGQLELELPAGWKEHDALSLEALDPSGRSLRKWTWPLGGELDWLEAGLSPQDGLPVQVTENDSMLTLSSNGISIVLDKRTGLLVQVRNNDTRVISVRNGPILTSGTASFRRMSHEADGPGHRVSLEFDGDLETVNWTMYPGGWVGLDYCYSLSGEYDHAGISFDFEEGNVISARWLGEGPYRVWKNRMQGTSFGLWEKAYNNTMAGTYPWNFPEFKGYHADVRWMELNTLDGRILVACPGEDLFVRLFEFYAFPRPTLYPALPPGDLSFLDAIPPIGTKMSMNINASAASTGPSGEPNVLEGTRTRTLYFNFGILP
jgi:hypothetical protein